MTIDSPRHAGTARSRPSRRSGSSLHPSDESDFPIVGIGASAGGLDACRKLLAALPARSGMAFILVQHLDPTHESMMVDLLSGYTAMTVREATDGMPIEREHLYVIPPGRYLSVGNGVLQLSQPKARHGARLPVDYLLRSMAQVLGERAICVILSGTGSDGSLGLKLVKEKCGLVIAQDPDEAGFDGMPRSAIKTGAVDLVLPTAEIPEAVLRHSRRETGARGDPALQDGTHEGLRRIIELLRTQTDFDFTLYKPGTLQRRIERRMAQAGGAIHDMDRYLEILRQDEAEREELAKDLLINVTTFFRDPEVFALLAETVIPELVRGHSNDRPLRIWIAGCSTGEESYSLGMLFREQIAKEKRNINLQIFASDIDPDAIASAREGVYPKAIEAHVSPERLSRFFTKEDAIYRVSPELRSAVVFTVQDILVDPPFARLDMISCRNLLIYLQPEAQTKVISLFDFALREGGVLLLGASETVGKADGRYETISKPARLYRHIGRSRPGEMFGTMITGTGAKVPPRAPHVSASSRQAELAELCRQLVMTTYAPAAVLINRKEECLNFLGPTDRYLHVLPGPPTHNLLAMVHQGLRTKLRSAIQQAVQENARILITGGRTNHNDDEASFSIAVQPVLHGGEDLLLICFVDEPKSDPEGRRTPAPRDVSRVAEFELELHATRMELEDAVRKQETAIEEKNAVKEEALSIHEEFQSTNEELLTSKEELQSLNEELTALNSQLHETLERERTISNDLQNVLYSTDVATIFLDTSLNIRFFTPAIKSLFHVIPGDIGRPFADLSSLAEDGALLADANMVLQTLTPIEHEIQANTGAWYVRRILPYRTQESGGEGVVITFTGITERKHVADALEAAKRQAELANAAKSRFLAAASHDIRQPLQTLALLQGLLAKLVKGEAAQKLVERLAEAVGAMSGMLNALLDINQIEAGTVSAETASFRVDELLDRMRDEFAYHAEARGLALRVVPCGLSIHSDPSLLEQMIRNLLSNALKYTPEGKILLGCRRRNGRLSIEIYDTGDGIHEDELSAIFEEYYQIDNSARDPSRGVGLGLSIVQRLAKLLGHRVSVRSIVGRGSVFAIEVVLAKGGTAPRREHLPGMDDGIQPGNRRTGEILIVEDDSDIREILQLAIESEGHRTATAPHGAAALELAARGTVRPDILLLDYNLPDHMDGLQVAAKFREKLHPGIPAIILTGDISTGTLRDIALQKCVHLSKPVKLNELAQVIQRLLAISPVSVRPRAPHTVDVADKSGSPIIFVVDDDRHIREVIRSQLEEEGWAVEDYSSCEAFLEARTPGRGACLLIDAYLPGMSGLELLKQLSDERSRLPAIVITGSSDVPMAVQAMKAGALDFIEKPIGRGELLASVERALSLSRDSTKLAELREDASTRIASLTPRQRQILEMVLAGNPSKNIAADLGVSQRTVENHRAAIMKKTGSKSLPALARLALAAA